MISALDTQEVATSQPAEATQVTTVGEKTQYEQTQVEEKPSQKLKISSIPTSTIDVSHSEEEYERVSPIPITVETRNGNDLHNFSDVFKGSNGKSSSPPPQPQPSSQSGPSSSALLLSSIIALSSLSDGCTMTPFMTQL